MQLLRVPNAASPTGPLGNAGAGNEYSDAESPQCQCDADQELHMSKRKGSLNNPPWIAVEGIGQVIHPKLPRKILSF
jgi:hypothetical protein